MTIPFLHKVEKKYGSTIWADPTISGRPAAEAVSSPTQKHQRALMAAFRGWSEQSKFGPCQKDAGSLEASPRIAQYYDVMLRLKADFL